MTDYRLWPATNGPAAPFLGDPPVNLGTAIRLDSTGYLTAMRYWRPTVDVTGPHPAGIYTAAGELVVATTILDSGTGWQETAVSPARELAAGTYIAACHFPSGYPVTQGYWWFGGEGYGGGLGIVQGLLVGLPDTGTGQRNGVFTYANDLAFPTSTFNASNYWIDAVVSDLPPAEPSARGIFTAASRRPAGLTPANRRGSTLQAARRAGATITGA